MEGRDWSFTTLQHYISYSNHYIHIVYIEERNERQNSDTERPGNPPQASWYFYVPGVSSDTLDRHCTSPSDGRQCKGTVTLQRINTSPSLHERPPPPALRHGVIFSISCVDRSLMTVKDWIAEWIERSPSSREVADSSPGRAKPKALT